MSETLLAKFDGQVLAFQDMVGCYLDAWLAFEV